MVSAAAIDRKKRAERLALVRHYLREAASSYDLPRCTVRVIGAASTADEWRDVADDFDAAAKRDESNAYLLRDCGTAATALCEGKIDEAVAALAQSEGVTVATWIETTREGMA